MNGDVFQLVLPSTSIFGKTEANKMPLEAYVKYLAAHGVNVEDVVTEMRFDIDSATPKLFFSPIRALEKPEHDICSLKAQTTEAKSAITMTVAQTDGVVAKSAPKLENPKAKPETEAEEIEEPVVKKSSKKEEAPAKSAADLVNQWDDE